MNWEIVAGIITLLGAFGLVAGWASKLSGTLASLEATLVALDKTLKELQNSNRESHKELYSRLEDHEGRLIKLETKDD
ncbi:MAG: hypothetical protein ACI4XN_09250 [Candidatus Kurthia intestinigallinarum]